MPRLILQQTIVRMADRVGTSSTVHPFMFVSLRSLALAGSAGFGLSLLSMLPAGAHQLAGVGLMEGALHPLTGLDHLLLLIGVGALVARVDRMLLMPALLGAIVGGVFGAAGGSIPGDEALAALAVSALGVLLLLSRRLGRSDASQALTGAVVGGAVAIHALLHGSESSGDALWWIGTALTAGAVVTLSAVGLSRAGARTVRAVATLLGISGLALAVFVFA